jgi:hypothetical protein
VLADRVAHVFYVLDPETGKHVVVSVKQKIVGVDNVEDNNEDINQFEEMSLFTNPMNIKHIEKDFDKNLLLYMRKGDRKICMIQLYEQLCITFHINVDIYVYGIKLKLFCLLSFV